MLMYTHAFSLSTGVYLQDLTYIDVAFSSQPRLRQEKTDEVIATICTFQTAKLWLRPIHALQNYLDNMKVCLGWGRGRLACGRGKGKWFVTLVLSFGCEADASVR